MTGGVPEPTFSSRPWTPEISQELDAWRQGHNFEGAIPLAIRDDSDVEAFWSPADVVAQVGSHRVLAEDPAQIRRVLVISQGCDIIKSNFPCVTVVPVYDAAEVLPASQLGNIRAGRVWHLVHLTATPWSGTGTWVADLRLEFSLDKSALVGKIPIDSFEDEIGYAKLAERLALVRSRPAVPESCLQHVVKPLQLELEARAKRRTDVLGGVRELRVQSNDHANPSAVTLFVVTDETQSVDREEWFVIVQAVREHSESNGLTLIGPEFASLWDMTAADYVTSQAVSAADSS